MKTYKTIYPFEAIENIKEGKIVCMADREKETIESVNTMEVEDLAFILKNDNKSKRFDFWVVEEEGENK